MPQFFADPTFLGFVLFSVFAIPFYSSKRNLFLYSVFEEAKKINEIGFAGSVGTIDHSVLEYVGAFDADAMIFMALDFSR